MNLSVDSSLGAGTRKQKRALITVIIICVAVQKVCSDYTISVDELRENGKF
jgi:hypothetical protein